MRTIKINIALNCYDTQLYSQLKFDIDNNTCSQNISGFLPIAYFVYHVLSEILPMKAGVCGVVVSGIAACVVDVVVVNPGVVVG